MARLWAVCVCVCVAGVGVAVRGAGDSVFAADSAAECVGDRISTLPDAKLRQIVKYFETCADDPNCCQPEAIEGFFNNSVANVDCLEQHTTNGCLGGFLADATSQEVQGCPAGYFCPEGITCMIKCTEGAYCPAAGTAAPLVGTNASGASASCQALGHCCPGGRAPLRNLDGTFLCAGAARNAACPPGRFCESPTEGQKCPPNHFCREGSITPQACSMFSFCKKGSQYPANNVGGLCGVLALVAVFYSITLLSRRRRCQRCVAHLRHSGSARFLASGEEKDDARLLQDLAADDEMLNIGPNGPRIPRRDFIIDLQFENLALKLKGSGYPVLSSVSGEIQHGHVTAVMGPSGAGKTTFLSTIAGKAYYGDRSGVLKINNDPTKDVSFYKRIVGFVPQEDVMHRELTVEEVLHFQAELRLPSSWSGAERKQKVESVLELLDLVDIRKSIIGDEEHRGVSGGQRKRVNIGMELCADPTLLMLDEPTSGLDSTSSLLVLGALKRVASEGGVTIVAVIHQPRYEIFAGFDDVLLLGKGGHTVYLGPSANAQRYFEGLGFGMPANMNPADFAMDAIAGTIESSRGGVDLFAEWATVEAETPPEPRTPAPEDNAYRPRVVDNGVVQYLTFLRRAFLLQWRNFWAVMTDLFLVFLAGVVLGFMNVDADLSKVQALNTFSSLVLALTAMLSSLRVFGSNRAVFWREAASGVNRLSLFLAENTAQLWIYLAVSPAVYLSVFYPLTSPRARLGPYFAAVACICFAASGVGYLMSVAVHPKNSQMAVVVVALIGSMLSGANPTLPNLDKIPAHLGTVLYSLSPNRWLLEALFDIEVTNYPTVLAPSVFGFEQKFGYSLDVDQRFNICCGVLVAMGLGTRALAFLALIGTHRGEQQ